MAIEPAILRGWHDKIHDFYLNQSAFLHGFTPISSVESLEEKLNDSKSLNRKLIGIDTGTLNYDFLVYPADSLVMQSCGYLVEQQPDNNLALFYVMGTFNENQFVQRNGLELFISKHLLRYGRIWIGESLPEGTPGDEVQVGWKYPPKKVLSADEAMQDDPKLYEKVVRFIDARKIDLAELIGPVEAIARKRGISIVSTESRHKKPENMYERLKARNQASFLDEAHAPDKFGWDVNGIRIIAANPNDCFELMGLIDKLYQTTLVLDLITTPRTNGYQALLMRFNRPFEFQIQTPRMYQTAESGTASNYRLTQKTR